MASDQCMMCARYRGDGTCAAFPKAIPSEIWSGEHNHEFPLAGDGGKTFILRTFTEDDEALAYPDGVDS